MNAPDIEARLAAMGDPARAAFFDGYARSAMRQLGVAVPKLREVVREASRALAKAPADEVIALALALGGTLEGRQVGYEVVAKHKGARAMLDGALLERLGAGIDNWASVDGFATWLVGPAWIAGRVDDATIARWARSPDRWWRRAALASCVLPAREGQADRVLPVVAMLAADRDDMVVKAVSWVLRSLVKPSPDRVRAFLAAHDVAARVRREVTTKLETGKKNA